MLGVPAPGKTGEGTSTGATTHKRELEMDESFGEHPAPSKQGLVRSLEGLIKIPWRVKNMVDLNSIMRNGAQNYLNRGFLSPETSFLGMLVVGGVSTICNVTTTGRLLALLLVCKSNTRDELASACHATPQWRNLQAWLPYSHLR
eukprot:6278112-Amphidinium_carterae.1